MISANITFEILLCRSPVLLFSFLRNSFTQFLTLLPGGYFPFKFSYSLFCILWLGFEFCYWLLNSSMQFSNSIIRLHSPLMQFWILLFSFTFCHSLYQFYYVVMNRFIQFPVLLFTFQLCSSKSGTLADGPLGTSNKSTPQNQKIYENTCLLK